MEELYYCFEDYPTLQSSFMSEGLSAEYKEHFHPHDFRSPCSFGNTKFVRTLKQNIGEVTALWIKNPPNTLYNWHIDKDIRKCSINFVIKQSDKAVALYRKPMYDVKEVIYYKTYTVKYIIGKPTILNVKKEHCVINPSDEERIILSLCVRESSYEDTLNFMKTLNITEY
jgi:hypothetical protein